MENSHRSADKRDVKKALFILLLMAFPLLGASAWRIIYAEEYYELYHEHLHHYPDDTLEDISYLESALKADFANPLYALAPIKDQVEWERYRYLFSMHVNLRLIYSWLTLGAKYDKMVAYFYNYPWKQQNLDSLTKAEAAYKEALAYWSKAQEWSEKAWAMRATHVDHIEEWETENFRIETGDLDYKDIIDTQLARLAKVRDAFQKMAPGTY
jgi:hypothetical protein